MYIAFDYKCPACGEFDSRFVRKSEMDEQRCECLADPLGTAMIRLPAGTRTTFRHADTRLKD